MGYSRFQVDGCGHTPLYIAIEVGCTPAVEILLRGDCLELLTSNTRVKHTILPREFEKIAQKNDHRLHDIIIENLLRHRLFLPGLLPYHDLATGWHGDNVEFAEKLFNAGFRDIDVYDELGYTPLMKACGHGSIRMASFFLQHGADPYKSHQHVDLRAGYFLCYKATCPSKKSYSSKCGLTSKGFEKKLLEAAFDTSIDTGFRCRCSPDGFIPITTMFRDMRIADTYNRKQSFQELIGNIDSPTDRKKYWRAFVMGEVFDRLEMTHTCLKLYPKLEFFPDNRRIEIEDEEEELFFEMEEVIARFDLFSENFGDDLSKCVDEFFDDFDGDLLIRR